MIVTVDCSAYIRRQCPDFCHEIEVDEPCTVQDFIRILADRWGESFRATVFDESHNLHAMTFRKIRIHRRSGCVICNSR